MSSFLLDSNSDLDTSNNQLSLTSGKQAIEQHLLVRFRMFLGEWFLNADVGVPYFRDILKKNPSFVRVQQILKAEIVNTPGVTELLEFNFDYDAINRQATLDFRCQTVDGEIDFTQLIGV